MKFLLLLATAIAFSSPALAEKIAIVGGKVFTLTSQGTLDKAMVLIDDGIIEKVTASMDVPKGYRVLDANGKIVTPGLIGAYTQLGLTEVASSAGTVDSSVKPVAVSGTGAAMDVSYALNPDSSLIPISRIEGITSVATSITSADQLFLGQGAVMTLLGDAEPVLKPKAFITVNVDNRGADEIGGSRAALWVTLEQALMEAEMARTPISPTSSWDGINSRSDLLALKPVLQGKTPLFMRADRAADIRQVIAFQQRHPSIKVVLLHGVEAWRVADELAAAEIPVIIDPEYNLPGRFDQLGATLANAGRLYAAGVVVSIGMESHNIRLATQHAGNAVANGLPYEAGLAALTVNPAKILGMSDTLGALAPGMQADVVVWSGDPLEVTQAAEHVFIKGKAIDMSSRQTLLNHRYLELSEAPEGKTSHYIKP
jgi:imidazolonepropionase-like amidohydrolase